MAADVEKHQCHLNIVFYANGYEMQMQRVCCSCLQRSSPAGWHLHHLPFPNQTYPICCSCSFCCKILQQDIIMLSVLKLSAKLIWHLSLQPDALHDILSHHHCQKFQSDFYPQPWKPSICPCKSWAVCVCHQKKTTWLHLLLPERHTKVWDE